MGDGVKSGVSEIFSFYDDIKNYFQQFDQFKGRIVELEMEKQKDREFSQVLENEKNVLLIQIFVKDSELKFLEEEVIKRITLNQQI